ncbi:MAG TPA: gamma-glutamyltransferase family protein [Solirubrobacteraceae bacterium]|jgi:gamma-glutamyltranspeptidase/glutathione hydrolase
MTTRPELVGSFGMVSSTHWLASAAGMAVLEQGGNAFDAAVAIGLTLEVVEPHLNGPGGEVPILLWSAADAKPHVVAGQGPAPAAATIDHFRGLGLDLIPGTGVLPACVPAAFDAWMLLLRDFGTLAPEQVMAYAIHYAEDGFPALPGIVAQIEGAQPYWENWTSSAELWLRGGRVPAVGSLIRNRPLAETFRRIVAESRAAGDAREAQIEGARNAFLRGFVAEAIDGFLARAKVLDSTGERHRGLLAGEDLAAFEAVLEEPVGLDYHGHTILKTGPWGQGPVMLAQLALLSGFDLDAMDRTGPDFIHTVVECAKLAFADREAWYGDPRSVEVPLDALLSDEYAAQRRGLVGADASHELRPGRYGGGPEPQLPPVVTVAQAGAAAGVGEPTMVGMGERGDTCHVDVVDRHGNMVAATPSGGWLQSSPTIPGLGFCLGTRGQMFWLTEGLPNSLAPRKRPRTTLSPSLALREAEPYMAFGTPGGDQQDQWSLVFLLSHLHHGMNLQEAIDAPTFHTTHFPSSFYPRQADPGHIEVESRMGEDTMRELRRRGHDVGVADPWSLGRLCAVSRTPDGVLRAGANPRGMQGYAAGR